MSQQDRIILITGATGYIGRRLKDRLLKRSDLRIRVLVRNPAKLRLSSYNKLDIIRGDTFQPEKLDQAVKEVDVAYYLIHSMGSGDDYSKRDRESAENFRQACIAAGVRRIIYLGGLGTTETASEHLLSRIETGEILSAHPEQLQTLWFRAGVIIGAGSASFEIIRHLTQKLPVMLTPKWVTTKTQPIAINDVLNYLEAALDISIEGNQQIDIGTKATDFKGLMQQAARSMGLHRFLIPIPFFSPKLSSYWLILLTPVPFSIASALIDGLKSETIAKNDHAQRYFPQIQPIPLAKAFDAALKELEQDQIISRWCDSSAGKSCDIQHQDDLHRALLFDRRSFALEGLDTHQLFNEICSLGGVGGWQAYDQLWKIRGIIDKLLGGVGLNRGRRQQQQLRIGDAVDFWKVIDLLPDKRLLLLAQMKLPGKGWLEFIIDNNELIQTAYFFPAGIWGRIYWYAVLPFHGFVFQRMGQRLLERAHKKNNP